MVWKSAWIVARPRNRRQGADTPRLVHRHTLTPKNAPKPQCNVFLTISVPSLILHAPIAMCVCLRGSDVRFGGRCMIAHNAYACRRSYISHGVYSVTRATFIVPGSPWVLLSASPSDCPLACSPSDCGVPVAFERIVSSLCRNVEPQTFLSFLEPCGWPQAIPLRAEHRYIRPFLSRERSSRRKEVRVYGGVVGATERACIMRDRLGTWCARLWRWCAT